MTEYLTPAQVATKWLLEGRENWRPQDAVNESKRLGRERLRERETRLLEAAERPGASAHVKAVAEQIRDHREAGNYTTQG